MCLVVFYFHNPGERRGEREGGFPGAVCEGGTGGEMIESRRAARGPNVFSDAGSLAYLNPMITPREVRALFPTHNLRSSNLSLCLLPLCSSFMIGRAILLLLPASMFKFFVFILAAVCLLGCLFSVSCLLVSHLQSEVG